jgi:hypothetical protein
VRVCRVLLPQATGFIDVQAPVIIRPTAICRIQQMAINILQHKMPFLLIAIADIQQWEGFKLPIEQ